MPMALDVEKLLADVSPDSPCGPDLSSEAAYFELTSAARGTPPREEMKGQTIDGAEPNWREVRSLAIELLGRSKDLNVVMVLLAAETAQSGLMGLRDGLRLLQGLLERHWEGLHPALDPDDDLDPLQRINLIDGLAAVPGIEWNPTNIQRRLREVPVTASRQLGRFTYRQVLMASGDLPKPKAEGADAGPDQNLIDAAFADSDPEALREMAAAAVEAVEASAAIDRWLTAKVGASNAKDMGAWHAAIRDVSSRLNAQLTKRGLSVTNPAASAERPGDGEGSNPGGPGAPAGPGPQRLAGEIHTREDVLNALGKVLDYYRQHEPSSPVPIVIKRALRLVPMSFAEVIMELAPAGVDQVRQIGGREDPFEGL